MQKRQLFSAEVKREAVLQLKAGELEYLLPAVSSGHLENRIGFTAKGVRFICGCPAGRLRRVVDLAV